MRANRVGLLKSRRGSKHFCMFAPDFDTMESAPLTHQKWSSPPHSICSMRIPNLFRHCIEDAAPKRGSISARVNPISSG